MKKSIIAINGSASSNSSNLKLLIKLEELLGKEVEVKIIDDLSILPHFKPELSENHTPIEVVELRELIESSDAVLICSPEYVFSIPSGLKNCLEWCVSTTIFAEKPVGLITASASGEAAHKEIKLIMKTLGSSFNEDTTLLIQGVKGKLDENGAVIDEKTRSELKKFTKDYLESIGF